MTESGLASTVDSRGVSCSFIQPCAEPVKSLEPQSTEGTKQLIYRHRDPGQLTARAQRAAATQ